MDARPSARWRGGDPAPPQSPSVLLAGLARLPAPLAARGMDDNRNLVAPYSGKNDNPKTNTKVESDAPNSASGASPHRLARRRERAARTRLTSMSIEPGNGTGASREPAPPRRDEPQHAWPGWPTDCRLPPQARERLERRWRLLTRHGMELRPCVLGPPEAFSAQLAPLNPGHWFWPRIDPARTGRRSATVGFRLGLSCAGWNEQPSAEEFHAAVHAQRPTERQQAIVYAWGLEATEIELIRAWAEQAYSWRTLVSGLHKAGFDVYSQIRVINDFAQTGQMAGIRLWEP